MAEDAWQSVNDGESAMGESGGPPDPDTRPGELVTGNDREAAYDAWLLGVGGQPFRDGYVSGVRWAVEQPEAARRLVAAWERGQAEDAEREAGERVGRGEDE